MAAVIGTSGPAFGAADDRSGYPTKPITLVMAFAPGGALDAVSRPLAQLMSEALGQQVVVVNRPGATGRIGALSVARAAPDGYTLLFSVASLMTLGPVVWKNAPYDPIEAFAPVVQITRGPFVLLAASSLPVRTMAELLAFAKARPGELNYGSPGVGSTHHLAGAVLNDVAGIRVEHVPYQGSGAVYSNIVGGHIQLMWDTMPGPISYIQSGTLRPLAVTGNRRLPALPDTPTFLEQGIDGVDVSFFYGIVAPAGTPKPIVDKLNAVTRKVLESPAMRSRLAEQGITPESGSAEDFAAFIKGDVQRWRDFTKRVGFQSVD